MSAAGDNRDQYSRDYQRLEQALPGADLPWLRRLRRDAMEGFLAAGFPTQRDEEWKYTDPSAIAKRYFHPLTQPPSIETEALTPHLLDEHAAYRVLFIDGVFVSEMTALRGLPEGVAVMSLGAALDKSPDEIQGVVGQLSEGSGRGFMSLNTAFMSGGAYIRLAKGTVLDRPIHLVFVATGAAGVAAYSRNIVVAGPDSRGAIIETYVALNDDAYFNNSVTEIVVEKGATLEHYKLINEASKAYHVGASHVRQGPDSRYIAHNVTIGGRVVRNELCAVLDAEGSDCIMNGLYLARGRQHVDNHTRVDHRQPHCTSREWYKGVLDGHARGVFTGRVVVHQDAQHTDAQQSNSNLLLSDDAEADSRPQLEIYADDVKCTHGGTVGQLDEEALFYLRSRAVDERLARGLLIYAFADEVLQRMELSAVRGYIGSLLNSWFPYGEFSGKSQ